MSPRRAGLADEVLVDAGHDPEQRALAGAVEAEDADLGAGENESQMSFRTCLSGGYDLAEAFHRVDECCGIRPGTRVPGLGQTT